MIENVSVWFQATVWKSKTGHDMAGDTTTREGVKAGLGGHDAGASEGQKTHRSRCENVDEWMSLNDLP